MVEIVILMVEFLIVELMNFEGPRLRHAHGLPESTGSLEFLTRWFLARRNSSNTLKNETLEKESSQNG